jgi:hypothetical protein
MNYNKESYELILQAALSRGFEFVDFFTVDFSKQRRQIILRHDIDTSLPMAYEAAKIDTKYKIKSTFALQLSSHLYNPFTAANVNIVDGIHKLGHNIALHPRALAGQTTEEVRQSITKELQAIKCFFPYIQPVFIWHNPSLNMTLKNIEIPKMVNACSSAKEMHYISDSVLKHNPEDFLAVLDSHKFLHMLLHPTVWMSEKGNITSMLTFVLRNIICECNHEFMLQPVWEERFPNGLPERLLDKIEGMLNG